MPPDGNQTGNQEINGPFLKHSSQLKSSKFNFLAKEFKA